MPAYLNVAETWVPVEQVSVGASTDYARPVVIETTLSGRRRAQVADRPAHRDWQVRLGLATPVTLALWERLIDGVYGVGPFDWVDTFTAAAAAGGSPPPGEGPPEGAVVRPVVVTSLARADRTATSFQQLTALTITLSEIGPGSTGG